MNKTSGWKVITKKHDYDNDITIPAVVKPLAGGTDRIVCEMGGNSKADYDHAELIARAPELQAESARRLALLRRLNRHRVARGQFCPECSFAPLKVHKEINADGYTDYHADDCELAEELK